MRSLFITIARCGPCLLFCTSSVLAQSAWVDFVEETGTRIQLTTVAVSDDQEKDLATGDFDRDGDTDLIVVRKLPYTNPGPRTNVLLLNEHGVLVERTTQLAPGFLIPDDTRDAFVFDANNDTWPDVVTAATFNEMPRLFLNQGADGGGNWLGFAEAVSWLTTPFAPAPNFCAVTAGDVTGDGWDDLFFSDRGMLDDRLVVNNQDGTFSDETAARIPTSFNESRFGTQAYIVDLNGDDRAEIVNCSGNGDPPGVAYNDGVGVFPIAQTLPAFAAYQIGVGDFDDDDDIDLYVCDDGQDYLFFNDGLNPDQTVAWSPQEPVTGSVLTTGFNHHNHVIDIDHDGHLDIGHADVDVDVPGCSGRFSLLRNKLSTSTTRGFADPNDGNPQPWNTFGNFDFAWIDLDVDGCADLVQGTCAGFRVFMQVSCTAETGTGFCFGDGGDQMGCTDCPCGNEATPGTRGGCLNGSGESARLFADGTTHVSSDTLSFALDGGNPNTFAVLVSAQNMLPGPASQSACAPGSGVQSTPPLDGLRCVGGALVRHGARAIDSAGSVGVSGSGWSGLASSFNAGEVRQFQAFYRESDRSGCGTGQNTSNGVSITVVP